MSFIEPIEKKELNEVYEFFKERTGGVPEWVGVMGHSPKIAKEFVDLFRTIMLEEGKLEASLKWRMGYVISQELKCPFCVDVTLKALKKMGMEEGEIENISGDVFDLVRDITVDGHLDEPELFESLKEEFSDTQIIELMSVIGFFNYINRFNNTLGIV